MGKIKDEINASSARDWALTGRNALVIVVGPTAPHDLKEVGGYITQQKFIYGLDNTEMERALGLAPGKLQPVAYVWKLARLPKAGEYDYRLSTAMPDGKFLDRDAETSEGSGVTNRQAMEMANDYYAGGADGEVPAEIASFYPPGSLLPMQWTILRGVKIPVAGSRIEVSKANSYPREGGSTKKWEQHGRKEVMDYMAPGMTNKT